MEIVKVVDSSHPSPVASGRIGGLFIVLTANAEGVPAPIELLAEYVRAFYDFARRWPDDRFAVEPGFGRSAGHTPEALAALFIDPPDNVSLPGELSAPS